DATLSSNLAQQTDAGELARVGCLAREPVGNNGYVCVHDMGAHSAAASLRFSAASWIAAISPNSSPKKLAGQFSIRPNKSTCNAVSFEAPSDVSQKYRAASSFEKVPSAMRRCKRRRRCSLWLSTMI